MINSFFNRPIDKASKEEIEDFKKLHDFLVSDPVKFPCAKKFLENFRINGKVDLTIYDPAILPWFFLMAFEAGGVLSATVGGAYTAYMNNPDSNLSELQLSWGLPMSLWGFTLIGTFGIGALSYMSPIPARQKFETEFTSIEKELGYDFCFSAERLLAIMKYNNLRGAINLETTPLLDADQSENLSL